MGIGGPRARGFWKSSKPLYLAITFTVSLELDNVEILNLISLDRKNSPIGNLEILNFALNN